MNEMILILLFGAQIESFEFQVTKDDVTYFFDIEHHYSGIGPRKDLIISSVQISNKTDLPESVTLKVANEKEFFEKYSKFGISKKETIQKLNYEKFSEIDIDYLFQHILTEEQEIWSESGKYKFSLKGNKNKNNQVLLNLHQQEFNRVKDLPVFHLVDEIINLEYDHFQKTNKFLTVFPFRTKYFSDNYKEEKKKKDFNKEKEIEKLKCGIVHLESQIEFINSELIPIEERAKLKIKEFNVLLAKIKEKTTRHFLKNKFINEVGTLYADGRWSSNVKDKIKEEIKAIKDILKEEEGSKIYQLNKICNKLFTKKNVFHQKVAGLPTSNRRII